MEVSPRCQQDPIAQGGIAGRHPAEPPRRKTAWCNDPDQLPAVVQRKQPVLRGAGQVTIGQEAIGAGNLGESLDRKTGLKGKSLQIGFLADDARPDQHLIRAGIHLSAARFGGAQQRRSKNMAQAVQFDRRTGFGFAQPIVVARPGDADEAGRKCRSLRHGTAQHAGAAAILHTIPPRQVTPPRKRYSRPVPDGL